jgi:hypothetical protein
MKMLTWFETPVEDLIALSNLLRLVNWISVEIQIQLQLLALLCPYGTNFGNMFDVSRGDAPRTIVLDENQIRASKFDDELEKIHGIPKRWKQ